MSKHAPNSDDSLGDDDIASTVTEILRHVEGYKTLLISSFAVGFLIPLSPVTPQVTHLRTHWFMGWPLGIWVFGLWSVGIACMFVAYGLTLISLRPRDRMKLFKRYLDIQKAKIEGDPESTKDAIKKAVAQAGVERNKLKRQLQQLEVGRYLVIAALTLLIICVAIEFYSFMACCTLHPVPTK